MSKLQGVVSKATLKDLKETNAALDLAKSHSCDGLIYKSNATSWDDAIVVSVTGASFAQEVEIEPDGRQKDHRTQKAFMILLVNPEIVDNDSAGCHIWAWKILTDKRVCRATLQGLSLIHI